MSAVAAAIGGAAVIGAVASSQASQSAANSQSQAADRAAQAQAIQQGKIENLNQPWIDSGKANLATLNSQMPDLTRSFTMNDFTADPGYQFQLNQGLTAMQRSAAARGFNDSTGTMKNLNDYAQNSASSAYGAAYQRFVNSQNQRYSMLAGLSNNGQVGVNQVGNFGANAATNIGNDMMGAGNAQASGTMGSANAWSGALTSGANSYMGYNMMNRFAPPPGAAPGGGGGYGGGPDLSGSNSLTMPSMGGSPAASYSLE